MVAQDCLPQVQACAVRVAKLDATGKPGGGANAMYATDSIVHVNTTPQYEAGDTITDKNACGTTVTSFIASPTFTRVNVEIEFIESNPYLLEIMLSQGSILAGAWGNGWAYPPIGVISSQFSLEIWAKRINNGVIDPTYPYAWWAFPLLKNVQLGARNFDSGAGHTIVTAEAYENTMWFDGPNNDWPAASSRVAQFVKSASLPTINCTPGTVTAS